MNEDCGCNNPCGLEPIGCNGCTEMTGCCIRSEWDDLDLFLDDDPDEVE